MQVHLINLDRSPERLAEFRALNAHLSDVRRFSAIDGSMVDREQPTIGELFDRRILESEIAYAPGALGCALSHLSLWQLAVDGNQALTICEDDAITHRRFEELAPRSIDGLATEWDLVLWGWNFDSVLVFDLVPGCSGCLARFDQKQMRKGIAAFQDHAAVPTLFKLRRAFGTVCYTISPGGAAKLRREALPIRPLDIHVPGLRVNVRNTGIDVVMNSLYPRLNAFVCFPPLVITKNVHENSTVQTRWPGNRLQDAHRTSS